MKKLHQGGCHCGAVRFECRLDPAEGTSRCNCSVCAKGRFWKAIARTRISGSCGARADLSDYQFGGEQHSPSLLPAVRHHAARPWPHGRVGGTFYAVNVACLDGTAPEEMAAGPIQFHWTANTTPGIRRRGEMRHLWTAQKVVEDRLWMVSSQGFRRAARDGGFDGRSTSIRYGDSTACSVGRATQAVVWW